MDFLKQSMVIEVVKQDGQINILVVEDNNYIRNLTISLLEMQHYNVISASNAFDAMDLAMYYSAKFLDLIIVDYQLPDFDGIDFIKKLKLKKDFQAVPTILLSQYSSECLINNCVDKDIFQMFHRVILKTDIYRFLVQEVKFLLNSNK